MKWRATFFEHSRKVLIENLYSICGVELNKPDKLKKLREAINNANQQYDALHSVLNDLSDAYTDIKFEMEDP